MGRRPTPIEGDRWERRFDKVLEVLPYALLAGSAVLSLIQPGQTSRERLVTAGLVALAAVWVLTMYTLRPPRWRERTVPKSVYFAGMLALAAVLTARSWFFVAFAVTPLVQAFFVLPTVLAFVAVFAGSVVIYTAPAGFPEPTVEAVSGWIFIICLQTALTGFFSYMGMKLWGEDQTLREHGLAVVVISHNLADVFEVADTIVVLRLGRQVAVLDTKQTNSDEVVAAITGAKAGDEQPAEVSEQ